MNDREHKEQIKQAKVDQKIAKYSKDYDTTLIIRFIFGIFGGLLLLVFILEGFSVGVFEKGAWHVRNGRFAVSRYRILRWLCQ